MVRRQAGHRHHLGAVGAQALLEVGSDEGAVHVLRDLGLALERLRLRLVLEGGRAGDELPAVGALVANVDHRRAPLTPRREGRGEIALEVGVVPLTARGIVHRLLDVDHEEGGEGHAPISVSFEGPGR